MAILKLRKINEIYWGIELPIDHMGVDSQLVMNELSKYSENFGDKITSIMEMSIQFALDNRYDLSFIDVCYPVTEKELPVSSLDECIAFFKEGFNNQYGSAIELINPKVIFLNITFRVIWEFPKVNTSRKEISQRMRVRVLDRDNSTCQLCGATIKDGVKLHVDHIIPLSKGGTNDMENLQTLCDKCNLGKGDFTELNMVRRRLD